MSALNESLTRTEMPLASGDAAMNAFLIVIIIVATVLLVHGLLVLAYALSPKRALQRRLDKFVRRW